MKKKLFLSPKQRKKFEKDLKKRTDIEEEIKNDVNAFYNVLDPDTIKSVINHMKEHGNTKEIEALSDIEKRYYTPTSQGGGLILEDILSLADGYDKMLDYHENDDYF